MIILLLTLVGRYIGPGDIVANVIGLTPDKIVSGNTILGIEGTASGGGLDTSDADATASDIAFDKTAYVNGEKITGTVRTVEAPNNGWGSLANFMDYNTYEPSTAIVQIAAEDDYLIRQGGKLETTIPYATIADTYGITGDKIVSGNTILGVEGTAEAGGGSSAGVKQFDTIDEMTADASKTEGDLAIVYGHRMAPFTEDTVASVITFPKHVYIEPPSPRPALSGSFDTSLGSSSIYLADFAHGGCSISINGHDDLTGDMTTVFYAYWDTTDLKSYTLTKFKAPGIEYTENIENDMVVDFGSNIQNMTVYEDYAMEYIGQFMLLDGGFHLDGLYKCNSDLQYELADTQYTSTTSEVVSGISFYGANGVQTGTLGDDAVSGALNDSSAKLYMLIQRQYDNLTITGTDTTPSGGVDNTVSLIPNKTDGTSILNTSGVTSMKRAFYGWENLLVGPNIDTSNVTNMSYMFRDAESMTVVPLYNTSKVTDMSYMFAYSGIRDVPTFDTSSVKNMQYMFSSCDNLVSAPAFDMSSVTTIYRMFSSCYSLRNVPQYDWSSVTNINLAFQHSTSLTDESLNNIMASLLTSPTIGALDDLGFSSNLITRCHSLSNYQALIDKGWTDS